MNRVLWIIKILLNGNATNNFICFVGTSTSWISFALLMSIGIPRVRLYHSKTILIEGFKSQGFRNFKTMLELFYFIYLQFIFFWSPWNVDYITAIIICYSSNIVIVWNIGKYLKLKSIHDLFFKIKSMIYDNNENLIYMVKKFQFLLGYLCYNWRKI